MTAKLTRARTRKAPEQSIEFQPIFTDEQVEKFEADYNTTWGVKRRLMMIVLARSSFGLISDGWTRGNGDAFVAVFEAIADYRNHLRNGIKLAHSALARLQCVAAHLDKTNTPKDRP